MRKLKAGGTPENFRQQLNLLQGRVDKGLATKAGVHAHDKNMMNQRKNLIEGVDRCGRVYDYSGLASVRCDQMKGAIEMDAGFLVDGDPISSGFGKCGDEVIGPFNHEMAIERNFRDFAKRGYDGGANRNVRDEMTIHDVHVEDGGSPIDGGLGVRAEASEVRPKGWRRASSIMGIFSRQPGHASLAAGRMIFSIIRSRIFSSSEKTDQAEDCPCFGQPATTNCRDRAWWWLPPARNRRGPHKLDSPRESHLACVERDITC